VQTIERLFKDMERIVLKLSGEALSNGTGEIYDNLFVDKVAENLKLCADRGFEIAVVVGAGNIWRGRSGGEMDRTDADRMGMLATVINAICLKDAIVRAGAEAVVMTAVPMYPFAEVYSADAAKAALSAGKIVVFGAGLGIPFLSTDTTGAVRAAEIGADAIYMAKNVDYIYTDDPRKNPDAKPLKEIKASEVLAMNLKALDATATAFCLSTGMPIKVFGLREPEDILRAIRGEVSGTVITAE
jgi:uridylate kinase